MQVRTASKRIPYLVDADFSNIQAQFLEPKKRGDSKESSWKEWQVSISVQQFGKERTYTAQREMGRQKVFPITLIELLLRAKYGSL